MKRAIADAVATMPEASLEVKLAGLVADVRTEFLDLVADALKSVQERAANADSQKQGVLSTVRFCVTAAHGELDKARANADGSPEYAATCLRRAAEALAKDAYRYLGKVQGGAKSPKLDDLIQQISNAGLPPTAVAALKAAQSFGNYVVHHQDGGHIGITAASLHALLRLFEQGLADYESWRNQTG